MLRLEPHGPDMFVGTGPQYPWGGLYGGQIVAQALRAAAHDRRAAVPGRTRSTPTSSAAATHAEPIRFEVDRVRNGRSFVHPPR